MESSLPSQFDVVVVGTGLVESVFAAACARAGKKILHLDHNQHYGARNATYNLKDMHSLLASANQHHAPHTPMVQVKNAQNIQSTNASKIHDGNAVLIQEKNNMEKSDMIRHLCHTADIPNNVEFHATSTSPDKAVAQLEYESYRYNIDLTPQLLTSSGQMVNTLRSSGVAAYLEFKPVDAHLYMDGGNEPLKRVPCSKGDIFSSKLTLIEKRSLMRFMQTCAALAPIVEPDLPDDPNAIAAPDAPAVLEKSEHILSGSFIDFAAAQGLTTGLTNVALYTIIHASSPSSDCDLSARAGVCIICRHIRSLGIFGSTAYLMNFYGSSELPQAFCRLCAVWGGIYMLTRSVQSIRLSGDGNVEQVLGPNEEWIKCDWLLINGDTSFNGPCDVVRNEKMNQRGLESEFPGIARFVAVLDAPLIGGENEHVCFACLYPDGTDNSETLNALIAPVFVWEQDESTAVAPKGKVLLHLSADMVPGMTPRALLEPALQRLIRAASGHMQSSFSDGMTGDVCEPQHDEESLAKLPKNTFTGANILWGAYFELPQRQQTFVPQCTNAKLPPNLLVCGDASLELSCDAAVIRAKQLFELVCPGSPFLPPRSDEADASDGEETAHVDAELAADAPETTFTQAVEDVA